MTYTFSCCDDGAGKTTGSIIKFDNVTILIDPGYFSEKVSYSEAVKYWSNIIGDVDIILLSQPTIECLGAYTFLYYNFISHFISRIQVYATLPVSNLGRVSTIDLYVSRGILGPYDTNQLDLEDIEKSFDAINVLKYSQLVDLRSKYDGLTLFACNSGYAPGGTIWCISTYSEKLVYAYRWNHTRDSILNAASLLDNSGKPLSSLVRPSAVITNFDKFGSSQPFRKRAKAFKDILKSGLNSGGTVIIPTNIGGEFLNLFVLVHDFIYENSKNNQYSRTPIVLVSYSKARALTYAKSMLEWFSSISSKTWENRNQKSAFDIGSNFSVATPDELLNYKGSKICFVSNVDTLIDEVLEKLSGQTKITTILTTEKENISILEDMHNYWEQYSKGDQNAKPFEILDYKAKHKLKSVVFEDLSNSEVDDFSMAIERRKKKHHRTEILTKKSLKKGTSMLASANDNKNTNTTEIKSEVDTSDLDDIEDLEEDEDDEDDNEDDNLLSILEDENKNDAGEQIPVDIVIQQNSNNKHKMFPFHPPKLKKDDYGIITKFDKFIPIEAEEDIIPIKRALDIDDGDDDTSDADYSASRLNTKRTRRDQQDIDDGESKFQDNIDYLKSTTNPKRRVEKQIEVNLDCLVTVINLEGLVDMRSTSIIWPLFKTRKIISLGPSAMQNHQVVMSLTRRDIDITQIEFNKEIEFNTTIKALDIAISPELDMILNWQRISSHYTLAHVIGRLVKESAHSTTSANAEDSQNINTNREKYILKPLNTHSAVQTNGSLAIGDVRLIQLKQNLNILHHTAEFRGEGTLVVDDKVIIRKVSDSETIIDGNPSELFYSVKKMVTDMLAKI
ncbi:Cleavage factor two protein 2 [Nakaseomyces bracarensis]|uniref:Cleavage and polyadenylation specificity factor subunit 2 n=1 Tax=Nakaseomyces bracarensis TaxID=273131 RepID=A0ABR4NVP1_9SACH